MPQLIVSVEGEFPSAYEIEKDEVTVGRKSDNDIHIPLSFVSSYHATFKKESNGAYRLIDRGSHNGTTVNGNNLGSAVLEDGDHISLGGIKATYRVTDTKPGKSSSAAAPLAVVVDEGSKEDVSEEKIRAELRKKVEKEIATELASEQKRVEELKRATAKIEEENTAVRKRLEDARADLEAAKTEASDQRSEMAMSNHLIQDLEKARATQEKNLEELKTSHRKLVADEESMRKKIDAAGKEFDSLQEKVEADKEAASRKAAEHEAEARLLDAEMKKKRAEEADLAKAVSEKEKSLADLEKEFAEKGRDLEEKSKAKILELEKKGEARSLELEKEAESKRLELEKANKATLVELEKEIEELNKKVTSKKARVTGLGVEQEKLEQKSKEATAAVEEAKGEVEELKRAAEDAKKEREEANTALEKAKAQVENAKREIEKTGREREAEKKKLEAEKKRLEETQSEIEKAGAEVDKAKAEIEKVKSDGGKAQEDSGKARETLKDLEEQLSDLEAQQEKKQSEIEGKAAELAKLDEECRKRKGDLEETGAKREKELEEQKSAKKELEETLAELEKAKGAVEEQKKAAKEMESELRILENRKQSNTKLEVEIGEKKTERKKLATDLSGKRKELRQIEKDFNAKTKALQKLEKREEELLAEVERHKENIDVEKKGRRELNKLEAEKKKLESENEKLSKVISEKSERVEGLDEDLKEKESRQEKLSRKITEKTSEIESLDDRIRDAGVALLNTLDDEPDKEEASSAGAKRIDLGGKRPASSRKAASTPFSSFEPPKSTAKSPAAANGRALTDIPLRIISPRLREAMHDYAEGAGSFDPERRPPVGIHALAACTKGSIHRSAESLHAGDYAALILLSGSLEKDRELIHNVSRHTGDKPLLACWQEDRLDRFAAKLEGGSAFQQFTDMLGGVDGLISLDPRTSTLLKELHVARRAIEVPSPCPIDAPDWDYSIPMEKRDPAIFVAADGFDPKSEDHRAKIEILNALVDEQGLKVTVYHHLPDIIEGLEISDDLLTEPDRTLSYDEFLSLMAKHRFVVGFGKNLAGGTPWGDALLTRNLSIGGEPGIESTLFPDTCLEGNDQKEICDLVGKLLWDNDKYEKAVDASRDRALEEVSFKAVQRKVVEFLGTISQELLTIS